MSFIETIRESDFLCEEDRDKIKEDSLYTSVLCLNDSNKCRYGLFFFCGGIYD